MAEPKGYLVVPVGFNPSGDIRALELDADDAVLMAIKSAAKGLVGPHGWIDGTWRKAPMPFGISGTVFRNWSNTNLPAGAVDLDDIVVPAGECWVITTFSMRYIGTPPTQLRMIVMTSGGGVIIREEKSVTSNQIYSLQCQLVMAPGDYLRVSTLDATAGDSMAGWALGYRIDIDQ